jgi:hypothetical protein
MKKPEKIDFKISSILILLISISCSQTLTDYKQAFNIGKIAGDNSGISRIADGRGFKGQVLMVKPTDENSSVTIWKTGDKGNWADAKYFIFEVFGDNDYAGVITLEFYKKTSGQPEKIVLQSGEKAETEEESPWLSCLLGINPSLKTKVVFPLSYLDAQEIFIPRSPRQLKGTITGNRLDPADITKVNLKFGPYINPYFTPEFEIAQQD